MGFNKKARNMPIKIEFLPPGITPSEYDWVDIALGETLIGKVRCKRMSSDDNVPETIIIYSINIYPEWAGQGYGREFVEYCQRNYTSIIADRVRYTAVGFWESLGFQNILDGNWRYDTPSSDLKREKSH
jgi:GNAT superfamily N-acetyltransferase